MRLFMAIMIMFMALSTPALAHKEHKKKPVQTERVVPAQGAPTAIGSNAMHAQMGEMMEAEKEDRSKMSTIERLLDWLGRAHPAVVHFPIAFFPLALLAAIVGRRRPAFAEPVRILIIAGGVVAPIAALLGWFDGGFDLATDDWLLNYHRWLGTGIGIAALGLGVWAWRRPDQDRGIGMILGLGLITIAVIVQGWFGGAMVHGVDHMNW